MSTIQLNSVTVSNFKAFGQKPTTLDLNKTGTCLIIGNNLDVGAEGESRNGVSKTSILESVVFALYGKGLNKNRPDDMVNYYNERNMVVELKLNVSGVDYTIKRGRKPNVLTFKSIVNGEEVDLTRDSLKNTDAAILSVIGVSYDIYLSVFFMNPWRSSFMSMSGTEQRSFMEQLLSLDTLAARAETLKKMRKDLNVDIKLAEKDLDHAKRTHDQAVERLEKAKSESAYWVSEMGRQIEEVGEEINRWDGIDFDGILEKHSSLVEKKEAARREKDDSKRDLERKVSDAESLKRDVAKAISTQINLKDRADRYFGDMQKQLDTASSKLPEGVTLEGLVEMEEVLQEAKDARIEVKRDMEENERTVRTSQQSIKRLTTLLNELNAEIESLEGGKCPYCEQSHFDAEKVESLKAKAAEIENPQIVELQDVVDAAEAKIRECEDQLNEITSIEGEIQIPMSSREFEKLSDAVVRIKESMTHNPHEETLKLAIEESEGDVDALRQFETEINDELVRLEGELRDLTESSITEMTQIDNEVTDSLEGFTSPDAVRMTKMKLDRAVEKKGELENAVNPYDHLVESTVVPDIAAEEKNLEDLQVKETHIGYLIRLLTDSKSFIRKNIVDQFMPFINKKIVEYTASLDLPHVPMINADMTVEIEYMGKDVSYHSMSRGEQLRLDVATSMAFRDLLEVMGISCNVLMLDEIFDSAVDQSGIKKMFRFVKNAADHVLLISHREEFQSMVDSTLLVTKSNSFASLKLVDRV